MPDPTPFQIGGIELSGFDAPEVIGNLGGENEIAFHRFPGGIISAQIFGTYPQSITFNQVLRGENAISKAQEINRLLNRREGVTLTYAGWSFFGVVKEVKIDPFNDGEIRYTVLFEPVSKAGDYGGGGSQLSSNDLLEAALAIADNQVTNPASDYTFDAGIQQSVSNLQNSVSNALSQSQNNLLNIPAATVSALQQQVSNLQKALQPLTLAGAAQAAAAADLSTTLNHVGIALKQFVPAMQLLTTTDPNLFSLASAYYGAPEKWTLIADANAALQGDPMPTGTFQILIPEDPGLIATSSPTFL